MEALRKPWFFSKIHVYGFLFVGKDRLMRGSHHIIAGLAMLGIGRAIVTVGENVDWSQVVPLSEIVGDKADSYGVIDAVRSWVSDGLDVLGGTIASWSTWIHQLFISDDAYWYISVAIGMPLFIIGTLLADADLPHSLLGRFMPWGTMWRRRGEDRSVTSPIVHRGWTHTLWALLGVGALAATVAPVLVWLLAGMVTHVLLDAASMAGWVWYYPLMPSTWKVIERDDTRIVVSTRSRSVVANRLRYHVGVPWLECGYVALLVVGGVVATWYTW